MKFIENGIYDTVCCETCGCDNGLHIRAVRVNQMGDVTAVNPEGTETYKTQDGRSARGSIVEIDFWCEFGGHETQALFKFHKGQVLHNMIKLPPMPFSSIDSSPATELARD